MLFVCKMCKMIIVTNLQRTYVADIMAPRSEDPKLIIRVISFELT